MHLPCLVVNLMIIESEFAVNVVTTLSNFINVTNINSCLERFAVFSWKKTFDAVYILVFLHCEKSV